MNAQAEFIFYLKAEIDAAMATVSDEITRMTFPAVYTVLTYEKSLERDGWLYTECLIRAVGGDPYGVLDYTDDAGCPCCAGPGDSSD